MTTDALVEELTELYIDWALSEDRWAVISPRWQKLARELQRRHNNSGPGSCTCSGCFERWAPASFDDTL
jgi:hypothetical protein